MKTTDHLLWIVLICTQPVTSWSDPSNIRPSSLLETTQKVPDQSVRTRGMIKREELKTTVAKGIPGLLAQVRLLPYKIRGRFIGFQLSMIKSGSTIENAGFKVGDVIISVNQEAIGKPEQMMHTLSLLPYAQTLRVEFERDKVRRVWTWLIN